jgi:hypothetical protein
VEVDGGGGGVGAGELASPSVSSASAQLELMCRVAETHMNSFMLIHTTRTKREEKTKQDPPKQSPEGRHMQAES